MPGMRSLTIVALLALPALPCNAAETAPSNEAVEVSLAAPSDALVDALARMGVEPDDLALPLPTGSTSLATGLAADPLSLDATAAALAEELAVADPLQALRWSWGILGRSPASGSRDEVEIPSLRSRVASRRDIRLARRLDPRVATLVVELDLLAHEAAALGLDTGPALEWLDAPDGGGRSAPPPSPMGGLPALIAPATQDSLADLSLRALARLLVAAESLPRDAEAWPEQAVALETAAGRIWIGSPGADLFDGPCWAVVDPGGDDLHRGGAAGQSFSVVLDLAGDDHYRDPAGAAAGLALQVDLSGDDDYRGGPAALGGGVGGCGVLWDASGDDRYESAGWGLGAGLAGVGLLVDGGGRDSYRGVGSGQGVGGPAGVGLLIDRTGDDTYDAWTGSDGAGSQGYGFGVTGAPGGTGILLDGAGNDRYHADGAAQGSGDRGGLGLVLDRGGDDVWCATSWAQGAAQDGGLGALVDGAGDDRYQAQRNAQGRAHDRSIAWFVDRSGDDLLSCLGEGQASASGNGFAVLDEGAGDDAYLVVEPGARWGHAEPLRGRPSVALLLDRSGVDTFGPGTEMGDARARVPGLHGMALDLPGGPVPLGVETTYAALVRGPTADEVAGLLDHVLAWQEHPEAAADAVARLVLAGPGLYPALRDRLDPAEPASAVGLGRVLEGMLSRDPAWRSDLAGRLEADLGSPGPESAVLLVWWAQSAGPDRTPGPALDLLDHSRAPVRVAAAAVLEGVDDEAARIGLVRSLTGEGDPDVRAAAVRSLGGSDSEEAVAPLAEALGDDALAVRDNATRSLVRLSRAGHRSAVLTAIRPLAAGGSIPALAVLAHVPDGRAVGELERLLADPRPGVRGRAALALGAIRGSAARKALLGREAVEADPYVLWCLDRALRAPGNPAALSLPLD